MLLWCHTYTHIHTSIMQYRCENKSPPITKKSVNCRPPTSFYIVCLMAVTWHIRCTARSTVTTNPCSMMTSSNGNIFRIADHLCGEFTGPRWIPHTKASDVYFDLRPNKRLIKQSWGWWFETLSCPLWRHRNGYCWWHGAYLAQTTRYRRPVALC